jgi:acyl carrier protein
MNTIYDQIINLLRENAKSGVLPPHVASMELSPATTLSDLGIDSLGKMGLLSALMDISDKYLSDDSIKDDDSIAHIVNLIS